MESEKIENSPQSTCLQVLNSMAEKYYRPLEKFLKANTHLIKTFPAFLLEPERIALYFGKNHLAIEYFGKVSTNFLSEDRDIAVSYYDYSHIGESLLEAIIGFKYDSTVKGLKFPLPPYIEDLIMPTNRGMDEMINLKWNFAAQDSIIGINSPSYIIPEGQFSRIVNGRFYDADENGLKTRHIKWIDIFPLSIAKTSVESELLSINITPVVSSIEHDAHFQYPQPEKLDYKFEKLPKINRFVELIGSKSTSETTITSFLEDQKNQFILTMGLFATKVLSQKICEWQSENKLAIKPDFFIVKPNGYADIIEFKLPHLKTASIVGRENRETFSAEISSYISQTRVYSQYFEDPNNRNWVENQYGIKVLYPKRILIVGRRWNFSSEEWRSIQAEFKDVEILTYEDLIDGVVAQFYM
ncbi:Shedu anti-phage system protein SduA domain-containing protein [Sphingobacterium sp.]|uniref:Shedu anti-phage system protein SduA domain-containing protein n=1 Tax=Sphingobacterium sp. TaxID=341027 RepID=UPI0031CE869D